MKALFECGTSRLHFAWWDGQELSGSLSMHYPEDGVFNAEVISGIVGKSEPELIAACAVSSIWRDKIFNVLHSYFPGKLATARFASDIGIRTPYENPDTYGIDRALASSGAFEIFRDSCVVVDIGTAVTVDAIDNAGAVLGGFIFQGSDMISGILADRTDLPFVRAEFEQKLLGTDTKSALEYGIGNGFIAAVESLIKSACESAGTSDRVVLTGGGSSKIAELLSKPVLCDPELVIKTLGRVSGNLPLHA